MRANYYGDMKIEVSVERKSLIERLKKNREKHQKEFEKAIQLWQNDLKEEIAKIEVEKHTHFPDKLELMQRICPVSYLNDYDDLIDMFEMGVNDQILLESEAFRKFCRDEWDWKSEISKNFYYKQVLQPA